MVIPFWFLQQLVVRPSWAEILFGYEGQLLSAQTVIDFAMEQVAALTETTDDQFMLAAASINDPLLEPLRRVVSSLPQPDSETLQRTWARILVAWIYLHREQWTNYLGLIEDVYADYDYPGELSHFVHYMPIQEPDLGRDGNRARMLVQLDDYVRRIHYAPP